MSHGGILKAVQVTRDQFKIPRRNVAMATKEGHCRNQNLTRTTYLSVSLVNPPHVNNNSNIDINSLDVIHPDLIRLDTGQINMPTCVINKLLLD